MNELVSIIVPVYNCEKYILDCLNSLEKQTYQEFEVLIVDDGSTDNTQTVCKAFCEAHRRFSYIYKNNGGVSSARNEGLKRIKGIFVGFVDADDYVEKDFLEKLVFNKEEYDFSICRILRFDRKGIKKRFFETKLSAFVNTPGVLDYFLVNKIYEVKNDCVTTDAIFGSCCRILFKRNIIINNLLTFDTCLKLGEDKLFVMNYMSKCKKGFLVDEYLYLYRSNDDSSTSKYCVGYNSRFMETTFLMHKAEIDFLETSSCNNKNELINYVAAINSYEFVINELKLSKTTNMNNLRILYKESLKKYFKFSVLKFKKIDKSKFKRLILFKLIKLRCFKFLKKQLSSM